MASASNSEVLQSATEKVHIDDIVSKDLTDVNPSLKELPGTDDKQKSPTIIKPPRGTETVPELFTNSKSNSIENTLSGPMKTAFSCQELSEEDDKQGSPIGRKPSSPIRTEILKNICIESASNSEVLQPTTKVHTDEISKDLTGVNHSLKEVPETDDKQKSPTIIKPPRNTEPVPEHCTNWKSNFVECTLGSPVKTALYEKALEIEASISKYSSKKDAASVENAIISSVKYSNGKVFPEDTGSVETVSIPFDYSESREVKKFSDSAANSKLDQTALNTTRTSYVSPSTLYNPIFQIYDMPPVSFPKMEEFSKSSYQEMKPPIIADMNCDKSLNELFSKMKEYSKSLHQEMKPPILDDMNCDKSLTELLSILEDWAKKGLDKAINGCTKINFLDIKALFESDVQYGLSVMKQMSTRIHTLMRAASNLPDPDTILAREFQLGRSRVRGALITCGFVMWHSIQDIELQISHDLKILEIMCDNVSKLSTENAKAIEEIVNPYNIVINLYTSVISRFLMLRTEMENFHKKIEAFCSDLEELL